MAGRLTEAAAMGKGETPAVTALLFIVLTTVAWWALALWPVSAGAPEWVLNVRTVCFGSRPDGLPDGGGWLLLVGQPIGMLGFLLIVWGDKVIGGLRSLQSMRAARAGLVCLACLLVGGAIAATARVATAVERSRAPAFRPEEVPAVARRSDPAAPLELLNQAGRPVTLEGLRGRPVILTFAFGHCETVCPAIVRQVLEAQRRLADVRPVVLVVTLDPWRDTPSRLPHIAAAWKLGRDAHVLSGSVEEVESTLDRWNVPRSRDRRTGNVVHPPLVYLIDAAGTVTHAVTGPATRIPELLRESAA